MKKSISDLIIELHHLAREQPDDKTKFAIIKIADDLARVGNEQLENLLAGDTTIGNDKDYKVDTLDAIPERKYKFEGDCV